MFQLRDRATSLKLFGVFLTLLFSISFNSHAKNKCYPLSESFDTGWLAPSSRNTLAQINKQKAELEGLSFSQVIAWEPKEGNELRRKLIRYHGMDELAVKLPTYDETQKLGPAKVKIEEIRFSQVDCQNASDGGYTVIDNARAFKEGTLKQSQLPKIRVWRDTDGKIWTLDHRRLAAMRISGAIDEVEIEFVSKQLVESQKFKFATRSEGKSIFVVLPKIEGKPALAIVVADKNFKTVPRTYNRKAPSTKTVDKILANYSPEIQEKWINGRSYDHALKLERISTEMSQSLKHLEPSASSNFKSAFGEFGDFSSRGKSAESILAKLIRKDITAFERGESGITDMKKAVGAIGDGIGARLTFKANHENFIDPNIVEDFVKKTILEIRNGTQVTEIMNYRAAGANGLPYLSEDQVDRIRKAHALMRHTLTKSGAKVPEPLIVKTGSTATFPDGYTAFHMNIKYPSGLLAEVQIRGPQMNQAAEIKHLFYDLNAGKVLSPTHAKNPVIVKVAEEYKNLPAPLKEKMTSYIEAQLIYARQVETGTTIGPPPQLPPGIDESFSFEKLKPHLIHD